MEFSLEQALAKLKNADALTISDFLQNSNWSTVSAGYTTLSERVGVVKLNMDQPIVLADKLEYHLINIDVHYVFDGEDEIRLKPKVDCNEEFRPYISDEDYG